MIEYNPDRIRLARESEGYTQSQLASKLSSLSQSKLNKNKRKQNIKGAFKILNSEKIQGKNILLFDDIYTTGSTVKECSKILTRAGAKRIGVLTIAKD